MQLILVYYINNHVSINTNPQNIASKLVFELLVIHRYARL